MSKRTRPTARLISRCVSNDLDPKAVRVELYANGINGDDPARVEMQCSPAIGPVPLLRLSRNRTHDTSRQAIYTARVIAKCSGVAVPLESAQILWQR